MHRNFQQWLSLAFTATGDVVMPYCAAAVIWRSET